MGTRLFAPVEPLPRGPHDLPREDVAASQRVRLMAALTEMVAERGYAAATIGELARRASVSRGTFYEHFADKEACLLAAYDHFAAALLGAMTAEVGEDTPWESFIEAALAGYLGTLEREPTAARAFLVEMDAAGQTARRRRREGIHVFAAMLVQRHARVPRTRCLAGAPAGARLPRAGLGVRELVREALEDEAEPALTALAPDIVVWVTAMIEGAGTPT